MRPHRSWKMLISSNIFKNAYSVQIPNAGTYGIELACVLGMLLSKPGNTMEICAGIKPEHVEKAKKARCGRLCACKGSEKQSVLH